MVIKFDNPPSDEDLLALAKEASEKAYCPYSDFTVGAALESDTGRVYLGANIENASYPVALCAERVALADAVLNGERRFTRLAVYGKKKGSAAKACYPCGVCRQALSEFADENLIIITESKSQAKKNSFATLLPYSFGKESLI